MMIRILIKPNMKRERLAFLCNKYKRANNAYIQFSLKGNEYQIVKQAIFFAKIKKDLAIALLDFYAEKNYKFEQKDIVSLYKINDIALNEILHINLKYASPYVKVLTKNKHFIHQ
ncbi:hypothetical protein [Sulfurimonas sp. HSL-1716]|uniref:hypothetical protein n=1 Tax=Hydrocurvibacter sulfurireducens TaxID=3131937 RepID=UPI0031F9515E